MTGIRAEESRALRWEHVVAWVERNPSEPVTEAGFDHPRFAIYVWRSVRADGRDQDREVPPHAGVAR
jgi:hypothetical protein